VKAFRVGLTGGLASGKSTVATLLQEAGFRVVDADRLVADLYGPGAPGTAAVARLFGTGYLDAGGAVDKSKLAHLVFADDAARRELEGRIHPLVREAFGRMVNERATPIVLEATRLVEAGYAPDFDLIVSVEAPERVRLERAVARGLSEEQAVARLTAQGEGATRREAAHRLIWNDGTLADLEKKVDELIAEVRTRAAAS
jgi:dephospho-CoA kinase